EAANRNRVELGDRGERTGASNLDVNVAQYGSRLLGRKFVGDREARRAGDEAQALLEIKPVELIDDAIDVVVEPCPAALDVAIGLEHFFDRVGEARQGIEAKAPILHCLVNPPLRLRRQTRDLAPTISEEPERSRSSNRGVELAKRARRSIARVGKQPVAVRGLLLVEPLEGRTTHIDLPAQLEGIGETSRFYRVRDVGDGADIGGDVLPLVAVATRGALDQLPLLVAKGDGHAVDFRLGGEGELVERLKPKKAPDAIEKVA